MAQDEDLGRFRRGAELPEDPAPKPRFPHDVPLSSAALPLDRKILAALDSAGSVVAWDAATARRLYRLPLPGPEDAPQRLTCSPDGRFVALSPRSLPVGLIRVLELATGKEIRRFRGFSPTFSPDGETLAATDGKALRRWSMKAGAELPAFEECDVDLKWAATSPKGDLIAASAESSSSVAVWSVGQRQVLANLSGIGRDAAISLAFTPDGRTLAIGNHWGIRFWDVSAAPAREATLRAHDEYGLGSLAFSSDGRRLSASIRRRRLLVWDPASGSPLYTWSSFQEEHREIDASDGGDAAIWIDRAGIRIERLPLLLAGDGDGHVVRRLCFNTAGQVVTADERGNVRLWDPATQKEVRRLKLPFHGLVSLSKEGRWAVFTGDGTGVRIWDLEADREALSIESPARVRSVAVSPDAATMALGHLDGSLSLWDVGTRKQRFRIPLEMSVVNAISWSPDGKLLAWGDDTGAVAVAEGSRGLEPVCFRSRSEAAIQRLAFSADRRSVVATDARGFHWSYAVDLSREPARVGGGFGWTPDDRWNGSGFLQKCWPPDVQTVFSQDGRYAAGATTAGNLRIWQAPGAK